MKKFALCIVPAILLAMLLLSLSNNTNSAQEVAVLGNVPGNILNGGDVAQDEEFFYYTTSAASYRESGLYKVNKESLEKTKIANGNVNNLNISGDYIYYVVGAPGSLWKMSKSGRLKQPVVFSQMTNVIISGGRIYYRLTLCDGPWIKTEWLKPFLGSIYSCDLNGRNKKLISKDEILRFVVDGEIIYYIDHTDDYSIWKMDTSGKNREKLHSSKSSEINFSVPNFDEKYLYFTADDYLYRIDKETLEKEVLLKESFSDMIVYGDSIFFCTSDERGIYRLSKDGKKMEHLFKGRFSGFEVAENSLFFYYNKEGLHRFEIETRKLTKLSDD